jgi:hypothetical protein
MAQRKNRWAAVIATIPTGISHGCGRRPVSQAYSLFKAQRRAMSSEPIEAAAVSAHEPTTKRWAIATRTRSPIRPADQGRPGTDTVARTGPSATPDGLFTATMLVIRLR